MQRPDLLRPAEESLADSVLHLAEPGLVARTRATGTIHLGADSDVTWAGGSLKSLSGDWETVGVVASGVTIITTIQLALVGGIVYLRGRCYRGSGWVVGANTVLTEIPVKFRPGVVAPISVSIDSGSATARVMTTGELQFVAQTGSGSSWPYLGGSYKI